MTQQLSMIRGKQVGVCIQGKREKNKGQHQKHSSQRCDWMSVSIPYQQNSYKTVDGDGHSPTWARVVAIFVSHFDWWTSHLKERKMGQVRARFSKHISSNLDQIAWTLPVADIHASRTDFALFDVASWARLDNTSSIMFLTHETRVGVEIFFHFEGNYFLSNINIIFTETFFFK